MIHATRSIEKVNGLLDEFRDKVDLFGIGVRVLGLLIDTIKNVAKSIVLGGGWFGLILSLVRIYKNLRKLRLVPEEAEVAWVVV